MGEAAVGGPVACLTSHKHTGLSQLLYWTLAMGGAEVCWPSVGGPNSMGVA